MTERDEQKVLAQWLDLIGVLWCHAPNEARRSYRLAASLRAQGLKAGVPDVLIFSPPPDRQACPAVGCAVELKAASGRTEISDCQLAWIEALRAVGWHAFVAHGADDAIRRLQRAGYGQR
jgi:hypothetical protein